MTAFHFDLAISAVPSDTILVAELSAELSARLASAPVWEGHAAHSGGELSSTLMADQSRLAVVLHQRLWQRDAATCADAAILRQRVRERPGSVCVLVLDDAPVPSWLSKAKRFNLAAEGLPAAVGFALDAVARCGGLVGDIAANDDFPAAPRWPEGPPPFLAQPRAQSTLRHELDALAVSLKSHVESCRSQQPGGEFALHVLPYRLIVRMGQIGISFSWITSRGSSVGDGRLLAIEWSGVASEVHGVAALRSATPVREQSYRAEGSGPERWCWRMDAPNGRAYSTANLLAEWLGSAAIASSGADTPSRDYVST